MFIRRARKRVVCKDGFSMSVQASEHHYCYPKVSLLDQRYESVEIGFPSKKESLLMPYAFDPEKPTKTVYEFVPAKIVLTIIDIHGGVVEGELPLFDLYQIKIYNEVADKVYKRVLDKVKKQKAYEELKEYLGIK